MSSRPQNSHPSTEIAIALLGACDARTRARIAIAERNDRLALEASRLAVTPALSRLYSLWGEPKEPTGEEARVMVRSGIVRGEGMGREATLPSRRRK